MSACKEKARNFFYNIFQKVIIKVKVLNIRTSITTLNLNIVVTTTLGGITNMKFHASALQTISDTSVNNLVIRKHISYFTLVGKTTNYIRATTIQVKALNY